MSATGDDSEERDSTARDWPTLIAGYYLTDGRGVLQKAIERYAESVEPPNKQRTAEVIIAQKVRTPHTAIPFDWDEFIEFEPMVDRYSHEDVQELATEMVTGNSEEVINDIKRAVKMAVNDDPEIAEEVGVDPADIDWDKLHVRPKNTPPIDLRQLRSRHINDMLSISGIVKKETEVKPRMVQAGFYCSQCGGVNAVEQPAVDQLKRPSGCNLCEDGGPQDLSLEVDAPETKYADLQTIQIQERPENISGQEEPRTETCRVKRDLVGQIKSGDRITLTGDYKVKATEGEGDRPTVTETYIDGRGVHFDEKNFKDITINPEDVERIKDIAHSDDVVEMIVNSIAPSIFGQENIKKAVALQLFGGVPKKIPDGTDKRPDIHVLLIGDPGTGKSVILGYVKKIAPRAVYASGKSASGAGLTAAAVKDDFGDGNGWTLEAGALVMADRGIAAVDELDKMSAEDRGSMHEGLEQQEISVAKAGINATLKTRCSLVAAANPKYGRFDTYEALAEQIDLDPALISRFDLIFTIQDKPGEEGEIEDDDLADHIMTGNKAGQKIARIAVEKGYDPREIDAEVRTEIAKEEDIELDQVQPVIEPEMLRKYIAYAKRHCHPEMTDEAEEHIKEFFVDFREDAEDDGEAADDAPIPVTARKLEALTRLAEASARMRLSDRVTKQDAELAIELTMETLEDVALGPEGEYDADMIESSTSTSQRKKIKSIIGAVRQLLDKTNEDILVEMGYTEDDLEDFRKQGVPREALLEHPDLDDIREDELDHEISKLKQKGQIYEPQTGRYVDM